MNVLIDASSITRKKAGVGTYAKNLIEQLIRIHPGPHFFVLAQDDDQELNFAGRENVTMLRVSAKWFRKLPLRVLLEQAFLPLLLVKNRIDVLHSLHYSFPLVRFGTRQVVTVHDMTFFSMPEVHEFIKIKYFRFFIRAAARLADRIVFVSHSTWRDCLDRLGPLRGSCSVIHLGKSDAFHPGLDPVQVQQVRDKYGLQVNYILYIGTIEPRKNLANLIRAFGSISQQHPGLLLTIAGMKGWMYDDLQEIIVRLKLESRVIFTGFVPEEDKPFLIAAARAFAYPSLYEGFGIPVLEALACGVPTLTSNVSSLPEVAGDAALLVDPRNVESISLALERLLSDNVLRDRLRTESIAQAAKFTWAKTAEETLHAYQDVYPGNVS
jgi:glycosyltransferase involved in cell wall biosynthesis